MRDLPPDDAATLHRAESYLLAVHPQGGMSYCLVEELAEALRVHVNRPRRWLWFSKRIWAYRLRRQARRIKNQRRSLREMHRGLRNAKFAAYAEVRIERAKQTQVRGQRNDAWKVLAGIHEIADAGDMSDAIMDLTERYAITQGLSDANQHANFGVSGIRRLWIDGKEQQP